MPHLILSFPLSKLIILSVIRGDQVVEPQSSVVGGDFTVTNLANDNLQIINCSYLVTVHVATMEQVQGQVAH